MSYKAKALGIPNRDLTRAMILVRDLRVKALREDLDPRATRIAIIFANLADLHFARQKLSPKDLEKLEEIARELYTQARVGYGE